MRHFAAALSALDEAETDRLVRLLAGTYDAAMAQAPVPRRPPRLTRHAPLKTTTAATAAGDATTGE
jgi:hypothetical protein